jgi:hypothetical protein
LVGLVKVCCGNGSAIGRLDADGRLLLYFVAIIPSVIPDAGRRR